MQGYNYDRKDCNEDQILWAGVIEGDKDALSVLFDTYAKELLTYGFRICGDTALVKDAIQDVFVDIWLYRNNLSAQVQVKFYLYRCLRRAVVRQMSGQQVTHSELSDVDRFIEPELSPEAEWLSLETESQQNYRILKSLNLLSDREREVISLKYYSDMKIREIASMLDLKEQTVSNTLQNALTKLRKHLVFFLVCCQILADKVF